MMRQDIRQKKSQPKEELPAMICLKCDLAMELKQTAFSYLGRTFHTDVLRCPGCRAVFVPESLAKGRMNEVELIMEDK